jgi:methionine synthase I (cobalamin-dependent)
MMSTLRAALAERVVVADGAMGTMLQASDATIDDFSGYEGCNEILNVTRPDTPSSPPTPSSCTIPRRKTSAHE